MRRLIISIFALTIGVFAVAPAFAEETDFRTGDGIKKFWLQRDQEKGGGETGGGGGGG